MLIIMQQDKHVSREGFEYIDGYEEMLSYGKALICCGEIVGCWKSWLPCCGCFCCCFNDPYVDIPQGSVGLFTQFGKYLKTCKAGLHYVNPLSEAMAIMDTRILVMDIPAQRLMTKDDIPIQVDSCCYYHLAFPHLGFYRGTSMEGPIKKVVGRIIKNTITHFTFQELLEKRTEITDDIMKQVKPIIALRGLAMDRICLKNFAISQEIERDLVSAAVARRNAQSKILTSQGQMEVAKMIHDGAHILDSNTAIQVRYLQTLERLGKNSKTRLMYRSR